MAYQRFRKRHEIRLMKQSRFIELDLLRAFALSVMIMFHILWDLDYFNIVTLDDSIYYYAGFFPIIFFVLVGICLSIGYDKHKDNERKLYLHLLFRGVKIFAFGMLITFVTLFILPSKPIMFGVLHCIGLCIILSILFLRLKRVALLIAPIFILLGEAVARVSIASPTYMHFMVGLHQGKMWLSTIDYFPILPWFGYCLLGIGLGNLLYTAKKRKFKIPDLSKYLPARVFSRLGKHSLAVYLLHQPVIAGSMYVYINHSSIYSTLLSYLP